MSADGPPYDDFESFAAAAWPRLVRAAALLGLQHADAQDAAQDALARCFRAWRRVRGADDPWAYTHRILLNCVRASTRRRRYVMHPVAEVPDAGSPDEPWVDDDSLLRAVHNLPIGQREVITLRYFLDLSEQQTAHVLGVSIGTVKSRAHRATRALAHDTHLRNLEGEASHE